MLTSVICFVLLFVWKLHLNFEVKHALVPLRNIVFFIRRRYLMHHVLLTMANYLQ